MEPAPLSTFFRISPTLLAHNIATPRSQTSSSFSSPSFNEHQTGLKGYRESPASLNTAHQDNPLFEGFPVLAFGDPRAAPSGEAARAGDARAKGDSPKLQDQLHHLLKVLQTALELHSATDGLPEDVAPRLASELEAVAKKLKEKEREMPVERQLRAKVQLALTGAEATIRKLRATPTRSSPAASWDWRCNEPAASSPTIALPAGNRSSGGRVQPAKTTGVGSIRDSVCKQLLQSPSSSSMSPLSWNGPTAAACTPLFAGDDASMASPKELPTEQQRGQPQQWAAAGSCVVIPTGVSLSASPLSECAVEEVTSSEFQPLYNWMKATLRDSRGEAVRAALANTPSPLMYGSPLHRRIQRLLLSQRSPSPLRHAAAQTGGAQPYGAHTPVSAGPMWAREVDNSPATSNTDTSSSCHTPMTVMQDDAGVLPFRSSVSPFGPTLRERFAKSSTTAPEADGVRSTAAGEDLVAQPSQRKHQAEAAELVAELGLDLQLDPATTDSISNLEVLEHVERWAREQFIAAKRALQASKRPALDDDRDTSLDASSGCANFSAQSLVDIAIQTEPADARLGDQASPCCASTSGTQRAAAASAGWKLNAKGNAPDGGQVASKEPAVERKGGADDDADVDVSPRDDQTPLPNQDQHPGSLRNEGTGCASGLEIWLHKRSTASECGTTPACRGLFQVTPSSSCVAANRLSSSEDGQESRLVDAAGGVGPGSPIEATSVLSPGSDSALDRGLDSPSSSRSRPAAHVQRGRPLHGNAESNPSGAGLAHPSASTAAPRYDIVAALPAGASSSVGPSYSFAGPVASPEAASSDELPPEVLFTPGISSGGSKTTAGRHLSRIFHAAGGTGGSRAGGREGTTPPADARGCGGSMRHLAISTPPGDRSIGPPAASRLAPSAPRESICSGDESPPRATGRGEADAEVLFTPGNAQPGSRVAGGRLTVMPFRLASAVRVGDEESEDGGASAQTLSSISSVSIIASEPVNLTNAEGSMAQPAGGAHGAAASVPRSSLARHLRGFLTSLISCSHGSKAS